MSALWRDAVKYCCFLCVLYTDDAEKSSSKIIDCLSGKKVDAAVDFVSSDISIETLFNTLNLVSDESKIAAIYFVRNL